jgi:hypothetical protein
MRILDSNLTTAISALTKRPAISLTINDYVQHMSVYQSPNGTDNTHSACIAADNSIIRCAMTRNGAGGPWANSIFYQRITDPSIASQWSSWTLLPNSGNVMFMDGGIAVSNSSGTLHIFAQQGTGGNALYNWYSSDNGVTWGGPGVVLWPPLGAYTKGIASAGNNDVFFLYDVVGGEQVGCSLYNAGWSAIHTATLPVILAGAGIAVLWTGSEYIMVYSDTYSLYSATVDSTGTSWNTSTVIAPATTTAICRLYPQLVSINGVYNLTFIDADFGILTGETYNYPRTRQSIDGVHWSQGIIYHDNLCQYGAVLLNLPVPNTGTAGNRLYLFSMFLVQSTLNYTGAANQSLIASSDIMSYTRKEQKNKASELQLILDNANGQYNALVTSGTNYQPIGMQASCILSEGYYVGSPPTTIDNVIVGQYHIEQIHFVRSPEENHLLLIAYDIGRQLDDINRYQYVYTNQPIWFLLLEIATKAGIFNISRPLTPQMNEVVPYYLHQAGKTFRSSFDELCTTYQLYYFIDQNEALIIHELSSSDPSVWTYQPEIENIAFSASDAKRANHIVVSGKPPTGGSFAALTEAEVYDDAHMRAIGRERVLHYVDQKLTTQAECALKAAFLLLDEQRNTTISNVEIPVNPGLQLLDVITLNDYAAPTGSGQAGNVRIEQVSVVYDAEKAEFALKLGIEGV